MDFLIDKGHQVTVISGIPFFPAWSVFDGFSNWYKTTKHGRLTIIRCPLWIPAKPNGLTRIIHLISFSLTSFLPIFWMMLQRPNAVFSVIPTTFVLPSIFVSKFILRSKAHIWLHFQDLEIDAAFQLGILKSRFFYRIILWIEQKLVSAADTVSAISRSMLSRLELKRIPSSKLSLFPNWTDLSHVFPVKYSSPAQNYFRSTLDIKDDDFVVLYSGSMNQKQGFEIFEPLISILNEDQGIVWVFVGDGPMKNFLVQSTGHFPNVFHLPLQPYEMLNDLLNMADINIIPQKESVHDLVLPSKVLSILAAGKPIIATAPKGSELELLVSQVGECSLPGDIYALASVIKRLSQDKHELQSMSLSAHNMSTAYSMEEIIATFESLIVLKSTCHLP